MIDKSFYYFVFGALAIFLLSDLIEMIKSDTHNKGWINIIRDLAVIIFFIIYLWLSITPNKYINILELEKGIPTRPIAKFIGVIAIIVKIFSCNDENRLK